MGDSRINLFRASLFVIAILVGGFLGLNSGGPVIKAAQPRTAKLYYRTSDYIVYCEEPNGTEVYVAVNGVAGGITLKVIPGGCK